MLVSYIVIGRNDKIHLQRSLGTLLRIRDKERDEIIYVDDGSSDDSVKEAKKILSKEPNTKVLDTGCKDGSGCGHPRNLGVKEASGEYVFLHDSDDYMTEDALNRIANIIIRDEKPDVVLIPFLRKNKEVSELRTPSSINSGSAVARWAPAAWAKVIKKEKYVFTRENIIGEDIEWWIRQSDNLTSASKVMGDEPIYIWDRTGVSNISNTVEFFTNFSATLEQIVLTDQVENMGLNYKYVCDNLHNLAYLMELKGKLKTKGSIESWRANTINSIKNLMMGHHCH